MHELHRVHAHLPQLSRDLDVSLDRPLLVRRARFPGRSARLDDNEIAAIFSRPAKFGLIEVHLASDGPKVHVPDPATSLRVVAIVMPIAFPKIDPLDVGRSLASG